MATDVAWFRVGGGVTLQQAIDSAAVAGGVVYVPRGATTLAATTIVPAASTPITILGDGAGATFLDATDIQLDVLQIARDNVRIEGMTIGGQSAPSGPGSGRGIVIDPGVRGVAVRDCILRWRGNHTLVVRAPSGATPTGDVLLERTVLAATHTSAPGHVLIESGVRGVEFRDCAIEVFGDQTAVKLEACEDVSIYNTRIDPSDGGGKFIVANGAINCRVIDGWFDEPTTASTINWMIDLDSGCRGWTVVGNYFIRRAKTDGTLKIVRMGGCASPIAGILVVGPDVNVVSGAMPDPDDLQILNAASEACLLGGFYYLGHDSAFTIPVEVRDESDRSVWISPRFSRPPRVDDSEPAPASAGHFGDLVARPRRGLESWRTNPDAWVPVGIPRYPSDETLNELPGNRSDGTMVWVDHPDPGKKNLRAWKGSESLWKGINFV